MQKQKFSHEHNQYYQFIQDSISNHLIMIRPHLFYCNQQTISDNMYQHHQQNQKPESIHKKALTQFDKFVNILRQNKIKVTVIQDPGINKTPDSIFPNNWVSFHYKHKAIIYPMCALNRRLQREIPLIEAIQKQLNKSIQIIHNYTFYENSQLFLEGTGSMVLDRKNKIVYACLSQRTNKRLVHKFCQDMQYLQCTFTASQYSIQKKIRIPIYHTNVLMSISQKFALICLQLIHGQEDQEYVKNMIESSGKQIIQLTEEQIRCFAGNSLTVKSQNNQIIMVMSEKGYKSLAQQQKNRIGKYVRIVYVDLNTIQKNGGGSARCMLAEFF